MMIRRRHALQSLGLGMGAGILSPLVQGFIRQARGQTVKPKRFVVFALGNGLHQKRYATTVRSESDWDLPESLSPLAPYKNKLLFLSKFYNPFGTELHGNDKHTLTVMPVVEPYGWQGGISIDRLIANKISSDTAFSSLAVTTSWFLGTPQVSADGPGKPYPAEWNPLRLYETIFGPADPNVVDAKSILAQKQSVLDFVAQDVSSVQKLLAGEERRKVEQYLESLRGLEVQLGQIDKTRSNCARPPAPHTDPEAVKADYVASARSNLKLMTESLLDVTFHALQCGMSRVASIGLMPGAPHTRVDGTDDNHHDSCHTDNQNNIKVFDQFWYGHIANFIRKLEGVKEGDGTMADNTLIMIVNTGGGEHHTGFDTHPVMFIGDAHGYLKTGRYLSFESQ